MNTKVFVPRGFNLDIDSVVEKWRSPSNIALVKYWGKAGRQIPANPSISFTLRNSYTETEIIFDKKENNLEEIEFELYFEGKKNKKFSKKIETFFENIKVFVPYLKHYKLKINTQNSFPHSSGIASSASGFSTIAACIVAFEKKVNDRLEESIAEKKISFLARLGSGSACRSIKGPLMIWGKHEDYRLSSDEIAVEPDLEIHSIFNEFQDTILLIDKGEKEVSSTLGHSLMIGHTFATQRFEQANAHMRELKSVLENGNIERFGEIVEKEALTLHAMMMTSTPYYILMKPNTLRALDAIKNYREKENVNLYFTLDAGANIHLLYPKSQKDKILPFIERELIAFCDKQQYICDEIGYGIEKI